MPPPSICRCDICHEQVAPIGFWQPGRHARQDNRIRAHCRKVWPARNFRVLQGEFRMVKSQTKGHPSSASFAEEAEATAKKEREIQPMRR